MEIGKLQTNVADATAIAAAMQFRRLENHDVVVTVAVADCNLKPSKDCETYHSSRVFSLLLVAGSDFKFWQKESYNCCLWLGHVLAMT